MISTAETAALRCLKDSHAVVHAFLSASKREDGMYSSAIDLSTILWAQEVHAGIDRSQSVVAKLANEKDEEAEKTRAKLSEVHRELCTLADKLWSVDEDVFGTGSVNP